MRHDWDGSFFLSKMEYDSMFNIPMSPQCNFFRKLAWRRQRCSKLNSTCSTGFLNAAIPFNFSPFLVSEMFLKGNTFHRKKWARKRHSKIKFSNWHSQKGRRYGSVNFYVLCNFLCFFCDYILKKVV